jgi:hypothetical protein
LKPILLFFKPICGFCVAKRTAKIGTEPELPSAEFKKRQGLKELSKLPDQGGTHQVDNQELIGLPAGPIN